MCGRPRLSLKNRVVHFMVTETIRCTNVPIPVSRVGLGTWAIGGWLWGGSEEAESVAAIQQAIDQGINLIDTAPVYGFGRSEEIVGKALAEGGRRAHTVLATKVGLEWTEDGKVFRNSTPARIQKEIEDSLRRLHSLEHGLVVLSYGAICRGLLSGKVTADRKFPESDLRSWDPKFQPPRIHQYLAAVDRLADYAKNRHNRSVLSFAIRWILDRGDTMTALWGARSAKQLEGVQEAFGWKLTAEDYAQVDRILQETITDPVGPEFMAPPHRDEKADSK